VNVITRKRGLAGLALIGASTMLLAGCAAAPEEDGTAAEGSDFLACAVSDEGSWNDKSFNEAAYDGLEKAEDELGVEIKGAESTSTEDFDPNLAAMVSANCDITFAVGFNLEAAVNAAAAANPEMHFAAIDSGNDLDFDGVPDVDNLKVIAYSMEQSSYLAGYLAASYSTTKVLGTYGGLQIPAVTAFMTGFVNGANAWAEDSGTPVTVLGWDPATETGSFTDGFADSTGAQGISDGQLAADADVIFPVAGGLFAATATSITTSGKNAVFIGVDKDIAVTQPEYADLVLTSVEKRMTQAVYDVIQDTEENGFNAETYTGTLENDGTALSDFGDFDVPDETIAKLDELKAGIIDGSIDPLS
jgi:basic membrane protein A